MTENYANFEQAMRRRERRIRAAVFSVAMALAVAAWLLSLFWGA